jgi:hypothetical protein
MSRKYSGPNHEGPALSSPYPTHRLSGSISLVDTAQQIEAASERIASQTNAQLQLIAAQMQQLKAQAEAILEKAQADVLLHHAECSLQKIPGKVYHLYERADTSRFLSLLSPEDYGGRPPHSHRGGFRLELDHSWSRLDRQSEPGGEQIPDVIEVG